MLPLTKKQLIVANLILKKSPRGTVFYCIGCGWPESDTTYLEYNLYLKP